MNRWIVAARAVDVHESTVKPKTRDGSNTNGYVYVPKDWLGETVFSLVGVENLELTDAKEGHVIQCTATDYDRPTPHKLGTGAGVYIHGDHIDTQCLILLNPTSIALEQLTEEP